MAETLFWALLTHPLLDSFTPYGTQLFYPFSDYRIAFNNIAVADLFYTIPFLVCILILMFFNRKSHKRRMWLRLGIGISSAYMLFTLGNKFYIDSIFEKSLNSEHIAFNRFRTQPTILNTILWYGVAETNDAFYLGFYSLLDESKTIKNWKKIPKVIPPIPMRDANLSTLAWFSDNYYVVYKTEDEGVYKYNDLRYPLLHPEDEKSSLFSFTVFQKNNRWDIKNSGPDFDKDFTLKDALDPMLKRLKGI